MNPNIRDLRTIKTDRILKGKFQSSSKIPELVRELLVLARKEIVDQTRVDRAIDRNEPKYGNKAAPQQYSGQLRVINQPDIDQHWKTNEANWVEQRHAQEENTVVNVCVDARANQTVGYSDLAILRKK